MFIIYSANMCWYLYYKNNEINLECSTVIEYLYLSKLYQVLCTKKKNTSLSTIYIVQHCVVLLCPQNYQKMYCVCMWWFVCKLGKNRWFSFLTYLLSNLCLFSVAEAICKLKWLVLLLHKCQQILPNIAHLQFC